MRPNTNIIRVSITIEPSTDHVGLILMQDENEDSIVVQSVPPSSAFAATEIKAGMRIKSINNVPAEFMSLTEAMRLISEAEGVLTVAAVAPSVPEAAPMLSINKALVPEVWVESSASTGGAPLLPLATAEPMEFPLATEIPALPFEDSFANNSSAGILDHDDSRAMLAPSPPPASPYSPIVVVSVVKPTPDSPVGIAFIQRRNVGVVVSRIDSEGLFYGTDLQVGMKVLAINDTDCSAGLSNGMAAVLLRSCPDAVTVRAIFPEQETALSKSGILSVTVYKASVSSRVGLGITDRRSSPPSDQGTVPMITTITEDGLCANTALEKELRLLCVNGIGCRGQKDAVAMLRMAEGAITILAGPVNVVAATVVQPPQRGGHGSPLGLTVEQDKGGKLVLGEVATGSLFAPTDLREGMQLLQINGMEVDQMQPHEVKNILNQVEGTVTVLARDNTKMPLNTTKVPLNTTTTGPSTPEAAPPSSAEAPTGSSEHPPPPGVTPGGHWGTGSYFGLRNSLLYCMVCSTACCLGLVTICFNMDTRVLYRDPKGSVYDEEGRFVGSESTAKFIYNPPGYLGPQPFSNQGLDCCGPNTTKVLIGTGTGIFVIWVICFAILGSQSY